MQDPKLVVLWILDSINLELSLPSHPIENANEGYELVSSTKCSYPLSFPGGSDGKESTYNAGDPGYGIEPRSPTLQADSLPSESSGKPKNTRVGSLSLLQGILPTQESNRGLLHCSRFFTSWATRESYWTNKNAKKCIMICHKCNYKLSKCSVVFDSAIQWTVAYQAPLPMEFSKQEYWCKLPFPTPGESSWPRDQPVSLESPA